MSIACLQNLLQLKSIEFLSIIIKEIKRLCLIDENSAFRLSQLVRLLSKGCFNLHNAEIGIYELLIL